VTDERMSDREIRDRFDSIDRRLDRMVPLDSWNLQNTHFTANLAELDRDCRERVETAQKANAARFKQVNERFAQKDQRGDRTWTRVLAVSVIAATLVAAVIGFYATTKGIK